MGVVSESEYATDATNIDTSHAAEEPPASQPGARMKVSLFRRFLRRE